MRPLLFVLFSVAAIAQVSQPGIKTVTTLPATCPTNGSNGVVYLLSGGSSGPYYCYPQDMWNAITGSSVGAAFSAITGGTNTGAAMVVGTGASLGTSGSGTIAATTATALAANPTDCSAGQYANAIAANGDLTCAQVAYSQVTGTPTIFNQTIQDEGSSVTQRSTMNFVGAGVSVADSGGKTTVTISGGGGGCSPSGSSGQILVDDGAGGCSSTTPTISGSTITATLSGNASTATALASNPTDCSAGQYANAIAASGNLTCGQVAYSDVSGTPTLRYQTVQDEGSGLTQRATINFTGSGITCTDNSGSSRTDCTVSGSGGAPAFSDITSATNTAAAMVVGSGASLAVSGSGTIAATTAAALASNPSDCTSGQYANAIAANGNLTCGQVAYSELSGTPTTNVTAASTFGTDNVLVRSDGTGRGTQATGITVDDSDNVRIPGSIATGSSPPAVTGTGIIGMGETTGQACVSGADCLIADSASHKILASFNNDTASALIRASDTASANTASKVVTRDGSGNFSAGTITAALTGNADTATALASNPTDCSSNQFANAIAASGNLTCAALTLAGAQFANQGTTTTVLHGNASGNPSFGAVVSADLNITTTTCSNQFVRSVSSGAVGTCASIAQADLPATTRNRGISFSIGDPAGSALSVASTTTAYVTVPFACTISAYNLLVDSGTITVKFWKVATGTAIPTSGNSISTSGVGISSGTAIHSTTVSDFTSTTVSANDIMAMNVTAASGPKYVSGVLQCDQ